MTDTLSKLFGSPARVKLLRLFLFNSQSTFTRRRGGGAHPHSLKDVQAELGLFAKLGVVRARTRALPALRAQ